MKYFVTTFMATAALLAAGLTFAHREDVNENKADSHPKMMEPAGYEESAGHHSGGGGNHKGGGHSNWISPEEAANRPNPVVATELSLTRGEAAYRVNCVTCHGTGARGDGQLAAHLNPTPPDLVMMAPMHPAGDLAWKIETGRGAMPAWKDTLSDRQIWDLVNYLMSLAGDGDEGVMGHHADRQDHSDGDHKN